MQCIRREGKQVRPGIAEFTTTVEKTVNYKTQNFVLALILKLVLKLF